MSNPLKGIGKVFKTVAKAAIKVAPIAMLAIGIGLAISAAPAMAGQPGVVQTSLAQAGMAGTGAGPPGVAGILAASEVPAGLTAAELAGAQVAINPAGVAGTGAIAAAPEFTGIAGPVTLSPSQVLYNPPGGGALPWVGAASRALSPGAAAPAPMTQEVSPTQQVASTQAGAAPNVMGTTPAGVGTGTPEATMSPYVQTGGPMSMEAPMPVGATGAPPPTAQPVLNPGVMGTTQGGGVMGWVERHPTASLLGAQFLLGGMGNMGETEAEIIAKQREEERERAERNLNVSGISLPGIYHARPRRIAARPRRIA